MEDTMPIFILMGFVLIVATFPPALLLGLLVGAIVGLCLDAKNNTIDQPPWD